MARREVWLGRTAAVVVGIAMASGSMGSASAWVKYPKPDLSKAPRMEHIMNQDCGTKGVQVQVKVLDYDHADLSSDVYGEARVQVTVRGFRGPVTVWGRSFGHAYNKQTRQPWQRIVAAPRNGPVVIVLPVAKVSHCSKLDFRVNDGDGRWTKAFSVVSVRATPEPHDSNGGTIYW